MNLALISASVFALMADPKHNDTILTNNKLAKYAHK
jgi:hypothetical protein